MFLLCVESAQKDSTGSLPLFLLSIYYGLGTTLDKGHAMVSEVPVLTEGRVEAKSTSSGPDFRLGGQEVLPQRDVGILIHCGQFPCQDPQGARAAGPE